ncbi:MAG: type II CAAX endopeptidase family protein, partial [Planctomycetota bacterium]
RFFLAILPLHTALLAVTLFAASRSRRSFRERLGLVRPLLPSSGPLAGSFVLGHAASGVSMVLAFLSALAYTLLFGQPSDEVIELNEMLGRQVGLPAAAVLLAVTVIPALSEELLYRGYAQTRLTERFGPVIAIAISSALFAITHAEPMQIVVVLPVGVVFGYVRWRSSSVYPAMIAHALYNCAALEVMRMGARAGEEPPLASTLLLLFIGLGGLAMLPLVLAILRRTPKPASFPGRNGGVRTALGQNLSRDGVLEDDPTADHGEGTEEQQ